jgi:HAE1 family hydrophobic/amphiphilic exporter-1
MAFLVIVVLGTVSFVRLPVDLFPELSLPMAVVWTEYSGAGPEEVENMVTRPIEEVISSLGNLKGVTSQSSAGSSVVMVNFDWNTNMDFAALDMRESIDMIRGFLPDEASRPVIFRFDPSLMPILQVGMRGDMDRSALTSLAGDVVKNRLERIDGVAVVNVEGGLVSEVEVLVDLQRLNSCGVPLTQLQQALMMENLNFVGGQFASGGRQYQVRTLGQFRSLEEMGGIIVGADKGGPVYLRDLAELHLDYKNKQIITRMNGEPVVSLNIRKQSDANTVRVATAVHAELNKMERDLPGNIHFKVAVDQSEYIGRSISSLISVVLIGAVLAVLVLFLFLGSLSSTLIISTAIPISVIAAFALMYFRNMTMNIVTLGGMALGVGMMVDNAIVILENIFRYRKLGEKPAEAALIGSGEVSGAITAATLTTLVVFLPIIFVQGLAAIIFESLAWTVAFALVASLVVALTVIPVLSARTLMLEQTFKQSFLSSPLKVTQGFLQKVYLFYGRTLEWSLRRRWLVVAIVFGTLLASLPLVPLIGFEFLPQEDSGMIFIDLELPVGSSLEETDMVAREIEMQLAANFPQVETVFSFIGSGGGFLDAAMTERALIYLTLVPQGERKITTREVAERVREELALIPGADITVTAQDITMGGMSMENSPVNIAVKGDDLVVLQELTEEITRAVKAVEGTRDVSSSFDQGRPEIQVRLQRDRAAALGVSTQQVASLIRASLEGQVITRYRVGGNEYDVRVKGSDTLKVEDIGTLKMLPLVTPAGNHAPLGQVAEVSVGVGPRSITRENQVRSAYVRGGIWGRDIGSIMRDVHEKVDSMELPLGYTVSYGGEIADIEDSFSSLAFALLLAIPLVYMIMAAQFESLLFPFIIMFSLPQAFTGVLLSLVLTGKALSVPSLLGVIMLSGIVVNNGIVLVDYINTLRARDYSRDEAIREAGPVRLRPILMTTLTTILGMLPLALGLGEGSEMQAPMAIVIIGGLSVSTLVTLIFVPVMYSLLDDFSLNVKGRLRRFTRQGRVASEE